MTGIRILLGGAVNSVDATADQVYLAGAFTTVGGTTREYAVAVDTTDGTLNNWDPNPNAACNYVEEINGTVYLGGDYTTVGA